MVFPGPCFNYETCLSFGLDYRVTAILIISFSFLVLSLFKGIRHYLINNINIHSSVQCNSCGKYLNGLAWCGNKACMEVWRERFGGDLFNASQRMERTN